MESKNIKIIASELNVKDWQIENTLQLLEEGATIPFISRYRKERTGQLDEVQISQIRERNLQLEEIEKRRKFILDTIEEQGKLSNDLKKKIQQAESLSLLEDLYLPYKPKRKTKATVAREKGLEPLAETILLQKDENINALAKTFVSKKKGVKDIQDALSGARDIIAEKVNEDISTRKSMRILYQNEAVVVAKVVKGKENEGHKYEAWFDHSEHLLEAPSHRILALLRGEQEGILKLSTAPNEKRSLDLLKRKFVKKNKSKSAEQVELAVKDGFKRLLGPSMENEIRALAKAKADEAAIRIFAENLRQLLLAAPLGHKNVLAIDPGFRTGCKLVCLNRQGDLIHSQTIYPHPPQENVVGSVKVIQGLVEAYQIEAIAIGNGTAGRETETLIRTMPLTRDVTIVMVNESGASIYSASEIARKEFPKHDITVRGAVSIGRRLMDPLAELVKIDPKSIGVGQYQHDVEQSSLQNSLADTVGSCVNNVGVDVNSASAELLTYVSGVGKTLANNIVDYRNKNGAFKSRKELMKVSRFGPKAFEQAAGFLRIHNAKNPLDKSAVHPESYGIVEKMAKKVGCKVDDLIVNPSLRKMIRLQDYVTQDVGLPTLNDIFKELEKPGRDPRQKFEAFSFAEGINEIEDLKEGMRLPGIVTNITAFGAFVDIGVHQDGLIHLSEMSHSYVKDPNEVVRLQQQVMVKVLNVDVKRKRISLSLK
ncbi:MAG: Tex family protein [Hyphomicrobiales bacterium]